MRLAPYLYSRLLTSLLFSILVLSTFQSSAQIEEKQSLEEAFQDARTKAFAKNWIEASSLLNKVLATNPDYHDARILMGRIHAWQKHFDPARKELASVLKKDSDNLDAFNALTDVEIWSGNFQTALELCEEALNYESNSFIFRYKKALSHTRLGQFENANQVVEQLAIDYPNDEKVLTLKSEIASKLYKYELMLLPGLDLFSKVFNPAIRSSVELRKKASWGGAVVRVNYSNRFENHGYQWELDIYPRITKKLTGYLNGGFSTSSLFPKYRLGAELFASINPRFEASVGIRYLEFSNNELIIYTGSLARNLGKKYRLSVRTFVTPESGITGFTMIGEFKRYFQTREDFISILVGSGFSPDFRAIQSANGLSEDQIFNLSAQQVELFAQKRINDRWLGGLRFALNRQELAFDLGEFVLISGITGQINYRF